jgi:hypothetical protein
MPSVEAPSPSASMDHFRTEVGHRAERLQRRHRRRAEGVAGAAALVVVLAVSLLIVTPSQPRHTVASPLSPPSPATKSPSGLLRPGPEAGGSATAAPGDQAGSSATSGSSPGRACRPSAVCIDAGALERQGALAATFGAQGNANVGISSVSVPADGVLEFSLTSSTATTWGRPTITKGAALKRRPTRAGPSRTATTDFVPVVASGSAVVSVTCLGTGCAGPSYRVDVAVVAKALSQRSTTATTR